MRAKAQKPISSPAEAEWLDRLRLIRSRRVGPATWRRLMAEHGTAAGALAALPGVAAAAGIEGYEVCPLPVALKEMAAARAAGAAMLWLDEPGYPPLLGQIGDAPPLLWLQGDPGLLARPMVALVGARNASSLGLRMARKLAAALGEAGYVVVSGLARGIDAEAHAAALGQGTVAVQAGGVDVIYPAENAGLAAEIAARGCRISEQPMGLVPQARHFPLRNRIVSGLARAVVVEAAARSGSLITAREALDQGREVLAVPGHPFDPRAAGGNQLIREGATLVRHAADVIEAIGTAHPAARSPEPQPDPPRRPLYEISAVHSRILDRLGPVPVPEDQLIRDLSLPAGRVAQELVALELEGRIQRDPGGLVSRPE
ncbi:DNA-processing protein DprA [Cereibacter sphaeroides]|uniref:DNA-processing protein DprA n=1 Tax=Cereibacter sphaeroides TaxID=1063 RepID=UPI00076F604F|nr:DNA-processing protein DprA [Cereibacter sphaeroides]AMJ46681.1 DNA processing protein DprA [Cereibacter sphaeroides]ANS33394.1 DNA processing protein DprA [Cereibacter sphaeroides]ATN62437.1 DNA processing protein DprA [Cereibacter sphaeroides]QHA12843.1 DNA-protecting protein DprA [Cereibacter sphaeroides]